MMSPGAITIVVTASTRPIKKSHCFLVARVDVGSLLFIELSVGFVIAKV